MNLTAPSNEELVREQKLIAKRQWLDNPVTIQALKDLGDIRDEYIKNSMNLSDDVPLDTNQITRNLLQAKTIDNVINKIKRL